MKFEKGDVVVCSSTDKVGIVVAVFEMVVGVFYNVLLDGNVVSFAEEELAKKDQ